MVVDRRHQPVVDRPERGERGWILIRSRPTPDTVPDDVSEGAGTQATYADQPDGIWWFHLRAIDDTGAAGTTVHRQIRIDATPPDAPAVASSTHPDQNQSYPNADPVFTWTADDTSSVDDYSWVLDQTADTVPDTLSNGSGSTATFTGLADGVWFFHVRARNGAGLWGDTAHFQVTVAAGGSVTVTAFDDLDGDGIHAAGEPALAGVRLDLVQAATTVTTGVTDATGLLTLGPAVPGTYTLVADPTTPYGAGSVTTSNTSQTVTISPEIITTADPVGIQAGADLELAGTVDQPQPAHGDQVTVTATLTNQGPAPAEDITVNVDIPAGYQLDATTVTAGTLTNLTWTLPAVAAGATETVTVTLTAQTLLPSEVGFEVTATNRTDPDSTPGNDNPTEDDQTVVTVDADGPVQLSGRVFEDQNGDGADDTEPGMADITVGVWTAGADGILNTADDQPLDVAVTDPNGAYTLTALTDGDYLITVDRDTTPIGTYQTTPDPTISATVTGPNPVDHIGWTDGIGVDGVAFADTNGNGQLDPTETVLTNTVIELVDPADPSTPITTDTTTDTGRFRMIPVTAGTYHLQLADPTSQWMVTTGNPVTIGTPALDIAFGVVAIHPGLDPNASQHLLLDPGRSETVAGSGAAGYNDGIGAAATFTAPRDIVVVGSIAYVADGNLLRQVDLTTNQVTTIAGDTANTCGGDTATTPKMYLAAALATNGTDVWIASRCGIHLYHPTDGTFNKIHSSRADHIAVTADGTVYYASNGNIYRLDQTTGAGIFTGQNGSQGLTATPTGVMTISSGGVIRRILPDDTNEIVVDFPDSSSDSTLAAAGNYLYWARGGTQIARYDLRTDDSMPVAGVHRSTGYVDGRRFDAWFGNDIGMYSNGHRLFVADPDNRVIRRVQPVEAIPIQQNPLLDVTVQIDEAEMQTIAGEPRGTLFAETYEDGAGDEATFSWPAEVEILDGTAYLVDRHAIRMIDLDTAEVSTFVGGEGAGCVASTVQSQVLLRDLHGVTSDGRYLYSLGDCGIGRHDLTTGATSIIPGYDFQTTDIQIGPDGMLYIASMGDIFVVDPWTERLVTTIAIGGGWRDPVAGITADEEYVWYVMPGRGLYRLNGYVPQLWVDDPGLTTGPPDIWRGVLYRELGVVSAGDYVYASGNNAIRRYTKSDKTAATVGSRADTGYEDGIGDQIQYSERTGLGTDGEFLYMVDIFNQTFRKLGQSSTFADGAFAYGWDGYGAWENGVNAGLGNYVTDAVDAQAETVGPRLEFVRTYNSLDETDGPLGQGWTHNYEFTWEEDPDWGHVSVLFPDGRKETHTKRGSGYAPPSGYHSKLETDGSGGFTLTLKDRTVYALSADNQLTSVTDHNGNRLDLSYDGSDHLETVTDSASGRKLTVTWSGDRIASVATDPVGGSAQVWKYYYTGGRLTEACDPRGNASGSDHCTTYSYTAENRIEQIVKPEGNDEAFVTYNTDDGTVASIRDGEGHTTFFDRSTDRQVVTTDPRGNTTTQQYDHRFRLVEEIDEAGHSTTFGYDGAGNRNQITDGNGTTVSMTYQYGNLRSQTDGTGATEWYTYTDDLLFQHLDGRASSSSDTTYETEHYYDGNRNLVRRVSPLGHVTLWEYSQGGEAAYGGGTLPAGLKLTEVDPRGVTSATSFDPAYATTFEYDPDGDLRRVTTPSGLVTVYDHDTLGRVTSETVTDPDAGTTATTTFTYDQVGNTEQVTHPAVINPVDGVNHQLRVTHVYDGNDNLVQVTEADLAGDDASRVTVYTYDDNDRETIADLGGVHGTIQREFDPAGNVVRVKDQNGVWTATSYDSRNLADIVTIENFDADPLDGAPAADTALVDYDYDAAGRTVTEKRWTATGSAQTTVFTYDGADRPDTTTRLAVVGPDGQSRDVLVEDLDYDGAGHVIRTTVGDDGFNRRVVDQVWDPDGRLTTVRVDPGGLDRVTSRTLDDAGNVVIETVTDDGVTEETRMAWDPAGRMTSSTVEMGADPDLVTVYGYDARGNQTTVTDPRGQASGDPAAYTTTVDYDLVGRATVTTGPAVPVDGGANGQAVTTVGYDTWGNLTHRRDPRNHVTVSVYDRQDRLTQVTHPAYDTGQTVITPVETFGYDPVGNKTSHIDRRGHQTTWDFDDLNRAYRQTDPSVGGAPAGTVETTYDLAGNPISTVDQAGARTEWTYDTLNRATSEKVTVRHPGQPDSFHITTTGYDDLGNPTQVTSPNLETTVAQFDADSNPVLVTDPTGAETATTYRHGRPVTVTDPAGRVTTYGYDPGGRLTTETTVGTDGTTSVINGYGYDRAGNRTHHTTPWGMEPGTDPGDHTTILVFDAADRLTSVTRPTAPGAAVTTSYGYDLSGNLTRLVDGDGHITTYSHTPWNQQETVVEPSTTTHTALADRTWTTIYDAAGLPVETVEPGGITVTRSFDQLGRLTSETGTGDGAATRSFTHDPLGRVKTVSHPAGTISLTWDDRSLLRSVTGPAGTATFGYDPNGRVTSREDGAGTFGFTWTARGELDTVTDPVTGTVINYDWTPDQLVDDITYGTGAQPAVRDYDYDPLGRLATDRLTDTSGATTALVDYDYDPNGNVTTKTVSLPGNPAAGTNLYGYDHANRLTSWTHNGNVTAYAWDARGNRIQAGSDVFGYDQRNRLTTSPEGTHTYTPRGTLTAIDDGTTVRSFDFDPLGRAVSVDDVTYTYDGWDRIATRTTTTGTEQFGYTGTSLDPTTSGSTVFGRSPTGRLVSVATPTTAGGVLAGANRHGDITHLHTANGTLTDTTIFDPYGQPQAVTGGSGSHIGYQGDWTDPASGHVWMGARWYQPNTATFTTRDTIQGLPDTPITLNRYTYAGANPLTYWDPDGRFVMKGDDPAAEMDMIGVSNATDYQEYLERKQRNAEQLREQAVHRERMERIKQTAADQLARAILISQLRNTARQGGIIAGTGTDGNIIYDQTANSTDRYTRAVRTLTGYILHGINDDGATYTINKASYELQARQLYHTLQQQVTAGELGVQAFNFFVFDTSCQGWNCGIEALGVLPWTKIAHIAGKLRYLDEATDLTRAATNAIDDASGLARYDPEYASRSILGQDFPGATGYGATPGGRTVSVHAAEQITYGAPGRPPTSLQYVDEILDTGTMVRYDPIRDTIRVTATQLPGRPFVVVSGSNPNHIVTAMVPK